MRSASRLVQQPVVSLVALDDLPHEGKPLGAAVIEVVYCVPFIWTHAADTERLLVEVGGIPLALWNMGNELLGREQHSGRFEPCYLLLEAALGPASPRSPAYQQHEEDHEGKADTAGAVEKAESAHPTGIALVSGSFASPWHGRKALAELC
jgi:hypothetical protein